MKTFNGHKDGMDSQRVAGTSSSKRTHGEMEGRSDGEKMSRSSMQLHVFFYDGVKRRNAWDLLPGEVIVGTEGQSEFLKCNVKSISNVGDRKEVEDAAKKLEWQGVCGPLLKLMSYGQDKIPLLRHRWCESSCLSVLHSAECIMACIDCSGGVTLNPFSLTSLQYNHSSC